MGNAALCLHPEVAWEKIMEGVQKSLSNINSYKPYKLESPYTLDLRLFKEQLVNDAIQFPGVKRTGDWSVSYKGDDLMEVIKVFRWLY